MSFFLSRSDQLRAYACRLISAAEIHDVISSLKKTYDIDVDGEIPRDCVETLSSSLSRLPSELVKACGIKHLSFEDLGPSREYFPNHGTYCMNRLTLNTQLLGDPLLEVSDSGQALNRFDQTLYHELGHGWDDVLGDGKGPGTELSGKPEWLELSGWSKKPKNGLRRVIIRESGTPEITGEYFYSPEAGFTRFYAKRNPWDDWADSFAYYVAGLKNFLPENKIKYFDDKLGKYFKKQKKDKKGK